MEQKKSSSHGQAPFQIPGSASDASTSLISRIGASASGLAKESLLRPSPGTIVNELSSADAGKSGSSSTSAGPSVTSMSLQTSTTTRPSSSGAGSFDSAHHTFRSEPSSEKTQAVIDDFDSFLSPQDQLQPNLVRPEDGSQLVPSLNPTGSDTSLSEGCIVTPPAFGSRPFGGAKYRVPNGHPEDGAAVVAMLSDQSFCVDEDPEFAAGFETVGDFSPSHERPTNDPDQRASMDLCRTANPLSLIPNFHGPLETHSSGFLGEDSRLKEQGGNQGKTAVLKSRFDPDFEVEPWIEIITTYHDEVWGDMLPLVEAAREEAKAIQHGDAGHGKGFLAIRRLAMIAGHMQQKAKG
ncbi:MAG: hypothetical protein Q9221_003668 [Calogaya cf. arnoldii]